VVTLQAYIWVVYGPNKVWDANYPGWDILWTSWEPSEGISGLYLTQVLNLSLNISPNSFVINPIMCHCSLSWDPDVICLVAAHLRLNMKENYYQGPLQIDLPCPHHRHVLSDFHDILHVMLAYMPILSQVGFLLDIACTVSKTCQFSCMKYVYY
jgi:hypothetical protein